MILEKRSCLHPQKSHEFLNSFEAKFVNIIQCIFLIYCNDNDKSSPRAGSAVNGCRKGEEDKNYKKVFLLKNNYQIDTMELVIRFLSSASKFNIINSLTYLRFHNYYSHYKFFEKLEVHVRIGPRNIDEMFRYSSTFRFHLTNVSAANL